MQLLRSIVWSKIYERNTKFLRDRFEAYAQGEAITTRVRAYLSLCARHDLDAMRGSIRVSPTASSPGPACTRPA